MREPRHSATFTSDFGHEFEVERERWLRRRFLWYTGITGGLSVLGLIVALITLVFARSLPMDQTVNFVIGTAATLLYVITFVHVYRRPTGRQSLLKVAYWLIVAGGMLQLFSGVVTAEAASSLVTKKDPAVVAGGIVATAGIGQIFLTHFFACLFLPWTPRESFRPLIPLLGVNAIITAIYVRHNIPLAVAAIALSPFIGLPGTAISWWRHSRFRDRFAMRMLRGRYTEMRRELVDARRIHEALFPKACEDGPVRFSYRYEPMRQIGGDYLYACSPPPDEGGCTILNLVVIDVTGHGIPAALTVNRLHGELQRVFAESPDVRPGEVLSLLNRYVHLTLASHSVYVTALCVRADERQSTLEYASGGHPPAFLRAVDGNLEQLNSTAFVLGACADRDFQSEPRTLKFHPGDTLIAYTDGATEARNAAGRMLGITGLQKIIALGRPDPVGGWAQTILRAVEQHRSGPPEDDTLVIEVVRVLQPDAVTAKPAAPHSVPVRAPTANVKA